MYFGNKTLVKCQRKFKKCISVSGRKAKALLRRLPPSSAAWLVSVTLSNMSAVETVGICTRKSQPLGLTPWKMAGYSSIPLLTTALTAMENVFLFSGSLRMKSSQGSARGRNFSSFWIRMILYRSTSLSRHVRTGGNHLQVTWMSTSYVQTKLHLRQKTARVNTHRLLSYLSLLKKTQPHG